MLALPKSRELRAQWQRAAECCLGRLTLALSARRLNWLCSTMPSLTLRRP